MSWSNPSAFGFIDTDNELAGFDVDAARALRQSSSAVLP
jgi:ABC-type amino acid transport substrate-binding protein